MASRQRHDFTFFGFSLLAYSSEKPNSKRLISSKNVRLSSPPSPTDVQFALAHGFSSLPGGAIGDVRGVLTSWRSSALSHHPSIFKLHFPFYIMELPSLTLVRCPSPGSEAMS